MDLLELLFQIPIAVLAEIAQSENRPRAAIWWIALVLTALVFLLPWGVMALIRNTPHIEGMAELFGYLFFPLLCFGAPVLFTIWLVLLGFIDRRRSIRAANEANFRIVRDLITQGNYADAQKVLANIDDPKARKWQQRLHILSRREPEFLNRFRP